MSNIAGTIGKRGLVGSEFMQLLGMLCSDYSPHASDVLLRRFQKKDLELVSFSFFRGAVVTCLLYEDFILESEKLFAVMDGAGKSGELTAGGGKMTLDSCLCD
jgi:hypothetical protein